MLPLLFHFFYAWHVKITKVLGTDLSVNNFVKMTTVTPMNLMHLHNIC